MKSDNLWKIWNKYYGDDSEDILAIIRDYVQTELDVLQFVPEKAPPPIPDPSVDDAELLRLEEEKKKQIKENSTKLREQLKANREKKAAEMKKAQEDEKQREEQARTSFKA